MLLVIVGRSSGQAPKSNFELWKESGHPTGTVEEYLASMKGADGDDNVFIQDNQPTLTNDQPALWIQTGMGPQGKGITLNLVKRRP